MIFHFHEFLICFWISHFVNDKKKRIAYNFESEAN